MKLISALPSRSVLALSLSAALLATSPLIWATERVATGDDGREITLKADGTWEYRSTDRFATSADGTRVRLQDNGRWEYVGNAPATTPDSVRTQALAVSLGDIITEFDKQKVGKNTRYNSRTTFYLTVKVSAYADPVTPKLGHLNLFKVTDSHGHQYPVMAVTPALKQLQPGEEYTVAVQADGSPAGQFATGIKYLYLEVEPAVFGTEAPLKFTRRADEATSVRNPSLVR